MDEKLRSQKLGGSRKVFIWVECEVEGGKKVAVGVVYVNPEETESLFEVVKSDVVVF